MAPRDTDPQPAASAGPRGGPRLGPWRRREALERGGLAVSLLACAAFPLSLIVVRRWFAGPGGFGSLALNLALGGLPVAFALAADWFAAGRRPVPAAAFGLLWLLFFPNAPYLVTELVELTDQPPAPIWFDALILGSAMLAGLLAAFGSLRVVQVRAARRVGAAWSWAASVGLLLVCGFGVYLGRFGRFNSWDVVFRPTSVLHEASGTGTPLPDRSAVAVTLLFSTLLVVGYAAVVAVGSLGARPPRRRPRGRGGPPHGPGGGPR